MVIYCPKCKEEARKINYSIGFSKWYNINFICKSCETKFSIEEYASD